MTSEPFSDLSLAEFSAATPQQWRAEAEATLKGAPFDKKLVTKTPEEIQIQPIYHRDDISSLPFADTLPGFAPFVRGTHALGFYGKEWEIAQETYCGEPSEFNRVALNELSRGQTTLCLTLDQAGRRGCDPDAADSTEVGRGGVSLATTDDLSQALHGINLEETPLDIQAGASSLAALSLLGAFLKKQGLDPAKIKGVLQQDPIGECLSGESRPFTIEQSLDQVAAVLRWSGSRSPLLQTICVRAYPYHDSGGNAVQELGFALATGVEYLRAMSARGLEVNTVAPKMRFSFGIGGDFFMAIAKFRAARWLWWRVIDACGGSSEAAKACLHARTGVWNKSTLDPYVNMLRVTTEAFSAVAGGCDSIQTAPFDETVRQPDEFSRRIARNTQIILREECNLDRVIDAAGGSWFLEKLTNDLAQKAWTQFQEIESRGGMLKALREGFPQAEIAKAAEAKIKAMAQRRSVLVGVNNYANAAEKPLETGKAPEIQPQRTAAVAAWRTKTAGAAKTAALENLGKGSLDDLLEATTAAAEQGATLGELSRSLGATARPAAEIAPLRFERAAEGFERLRQAVREAGTPHVFLANIGPIKQHKARADFSASFFRAGGFEVLENRGFPDAEAAVAAALESKAPIVVLCSTDETYPELVPAIAQALKASGKPLLILAGYPEEKIESYRSAGVDEFIHIRSNCYETLCGISRKLGIKL